MSAPCKILSSCFRGAFAGCPAALPGVVLALLAGAGAPLTAPAPPRGEAAHEDSPETGSRGGREVQYDEVELLPDDSEQQLRATVYSLPPRFFSGAAAETFLRGVRELDAERTLIALSSGPTLAHLRRREEGLGLHLLDSSGDRYSPWPRDPMSFRRSRKGGVILLLRPDRQPGRESDFEMGRTLVRELPEELDQALGGLRWTISPIPFHNGQILPADGAAWISLHSLEARILEILEVHRVPVKSFETAEGIDAYLAAARAAATELESLLGLETRFVHSLPVTGRPAERSGQLYALGGGAGFDLDSVLTLLQQPEGGVASLVADVDLGRSLLGGLTLSDLDAVAHTYGLSIRGEPLRRRLLLDQDSPRARGLDLFLDRVAAFLEAREAPSLRLPLLLVPTSLVAGRHDYSHPDFLLSWNNVVAEERAGVLRAEGFASGIPPADELARETFRRAGYRLDLLPPLVESIRLNGGYRCASNHLRLPHPLP